MRRPYPFDESFAYEHSYYRPPHPLDYYYSNYHPNYYSNYYPQYNRKRQRRQAAALVVESLWNDGGGNETSGNKTSTTPGRKSSAQPRPVLNIPPKGIGPIADPNLNDVLCGRGGRINSHAGNVQFRDIIHSKKKEYLAPSTKKLEKAHIAAGIVNDIRSMNPPGRFLKEEKGTGMWYDIGDAKAIKKTGQALREDAPDIRPGIDGDGGSSGDEKKPAASPENTGKSKGRSPNVSPRGNQIPILPQQAYGNNGGQQQMSSTDYQGQMSMPPPYMSQGNNNNTYSSQQSSQQQQYMQDQQAFETRNIPLQVPLQGNQSSFRGHPNQMYPDVQLATQKYGSASRKAMEALSEAGPMLQQQHAPYERHPEELAFGMAFHDPTNPRIITDDNTISTISGLSEPISSIISGRASSSVNRASDLMNMSLKSNISLTDSLRLRPSMRGSSSHNRTSIYDSLMTDRSSRGGSTKGYDGMLNGSIKSGFGASLTRSNSFPDNMNSSENWNFGGDDNEFSEEDFDRSMMGGRRSSSAMSIGSIMDMQSNASSSQWFQAAVGNLPQPDDKSFMSTAMMSADLDALDLASTF